MRSDDEREPLRERPGERPRLRRALRASGREGAARDAGGDALTAAQVREMAADFESNPTYRLLRNAVAEVSISRLASRQEVVIGADHSFSIALDSWPVTAQKQSGRCWMFAGLNLLRPAAAAKLRVNHFEFSQNFVMFWDKLEKANYFLEAMLELADRPLDDRAVSFLLKSPVSDGGQWDMFVSLVQKYGLVPKAVMPETESSSNSREMNRNLATKLRWGARQLRELAQRRAPRAELTKAKQELLGAIYRMLAIHLGTPPERFEWQWRDRDKKLRRDPELTPLEFTAKYAPADLGEYVCLVHDPRPDHPVGRTYTVEYLGNVRGAGRVTYLSVDIELMRRIALRTLRDGEPVWFGCDCSQQLDRDRGLWDARLRDYEGLYATELELSKADRLLHGATAMNHAMVFTGVDVLKGQPRRWRVENSWGDEVGRKGFFLMNDSWFTEHLFELAARRSYLPENLQEALAQPPLVLPAWDPMGSLAR